MSAISDKVTQAATNVVLSNAFFATLLMRLKRVEDPTCETFWTDGIHLGFNPVFADSLTTPEIEAVLVHEVMHCANRHITRGGNREHEQWNRACDLAINPTIEAEGYTLPKGRLLNPAFAGMSAEEIYMLLPPPDPNGGKGGSPNGCGEVRVPPSAEHIPSVDADWQAATIQAANAAKMQHGDLPAFIKRLVDEIREPQIRWQEVLTRFVQQTAKEDYTYRRPNKRYIYTGIYLPSMMSEQVPPLVIAVDTSGSIGEKTLRVFGGEMTGIADLCRPQCVYVMYVDAKVHRVDTFEQGETITVDPMGNGGTDFRPVWDKIKEMGIEPCCIIYLTDMYGSFPEDSQIPTIWASTTKDYNPPFGEMVYIDENKL